MLKKATDVKSDCVLVEFSRFKRKKQYIAKSPVRFR
jgi:hypothetical protein